MKKANTERTPEEVEAEVAALAGQVTPPDETETDAAGAKKERKKRQAQPAEKPDLLATPEFWGAVAAVPFELRARKTGYSEYRLTEPEARNIGLPLAELFSSVADRYFKKNPELAAAIAAIIVIGQAVVIREQGLADWRKANEAPK